MTEELTTFLFGQWVRLITLALAVTRRDDAIVHRVPLSQYTEYMFLDGEHTS